MLAYKDRILHHLGGAINCARELNNITLRNNFICIYFIISWNIK